MPMNFQGRRIYDLNGYPAVTWPEHPTSPEGQSYAYVHRIVAYGLWGDMVLGNHVHHRDEDRYNYAPENLELVSAADHIRLHRSWGSVIFPVERACSFCGNSVSVTTSARLNQADVYCDRRCAALSRTREEGRFV